MKGSFGQAPEARGHWAAASVLSIGGHAAALVWLLGLLPSFAAPQPRMTMPETAIVVTAALSRDAADAASLLTDPTAVSETETLDPETMTEALPPSDTPGGTILAAVIDEPAVTPGSPSAEPDTTAPDAEVASPEVLAAAPAETLSPVTTPPTAAQAAPAIQLAPVSDMGIGPDLAPPAAPAALGTAPIVAETIAGAVAGPAPGATLTSVLPPAPLPGGGPPPQQVAPPSPQDAALIALIERIRGRLDEACLVALPRPQPPPLGPLVVTLSDQDVTAARFAQDVLQGGDLPVDERRLVIDARQCAALTFLRSQPDYPAFALRMGVARSEVASGETLVGRIDGIAGAYVSLILVDDNGVVQDLRRFLRFTGGQAEFSIPVTRDGAPRETSQLLIALASPVPSDAVAQLAGGLADEVFPLLTGALPPRTRLAVQAVDIR